MPAQIGATLFFTDHNSLSGFSETHYLASANDLATALAAANTMAQARVLLLGDGVTLDYIRTSDANVRGDSAILPGLPPVQMSPLTYNKEMSAQYNGDNAALGLSGISDFPWTSLLCRCEMGTTQRRSLFLRGIPDLPTKDGTLLREPTFLKSFNKWVTAMIKGGWGARVLAKNGQGNPSKPITGITNVAGASPSITLTSPVHGLKVGDMVRISGVKYQAPPATKSTPINGLWQISSVPDQNTFTLSGFVGSVNYLFGGTVQVRSYVIQPYTDIIQVRFTSRKAGRPFGSIKSKRKKANQYH